MIGPNGLSVFLGKWRQVEVSRIALVAEFDRELPQ